MLSNRLLLHESEATACAHVPFLAEAASHAPSFQPSFSIVRPSLASSIHVAFLFLGHPSQVCHGDPQPWTGAKYGAPRDPYPFSPQLMVWTCSDIDVAIAASLRVEDIASIRASLDGVGGDPVSLAMAISRPSRGLGQRLDDGCLGQAVGSSGREALVDGQRTHRTSWKMEDEDSASRRLAGRQIAEAWKCGRGGKAGTTKANGWIPIQLGWYSSHAHV